MAALVCDICGGKLAMGAGGIALCDSCGMEHSTERMKEKVQEIKGTVRVDNSHLIDNYLNLANNAYDSNNQAEAESYCNKVIEIEPLNYQAWMLKGKAAGWQSTLKNQRFPECVSAFAKAINNAPEEELEKLKEDAVTEVKNLSRALISLRADRFSKFPDEGETQGFKSDLLGIMQAMSQFITQAGVVIPLTEMMSPIATQINQAVVQAWEKKVWPDYVGDENRPNQYEWRQFITRCGFCTDLIKQSIDICDEDGENDIQRYENLIFMHEKAIASCAWDYDFTQYGKKWRKSLCLSQDAIKFRQTAINTYKMQVIALKATKKATEDRIVREKLEAQNKGYWDAHREERNALEQEQASLPEEIKKLNDGIQKIPGGDQIANLEGQIADLNRQKHALGLFKSKEKKELQVQIDAVNAQINVVKERMESIQTPILARIDDLKARLKAVEEELYKPR